MDKPQIIGMLQRELNAMTDSLNTVCHDLTGLNNSVESITSTLDHNSFKQDSILAKLNEIQETGVGYSDIASQIALPLIIALLAFAFPFVFSVINHINSKYESLVITSLFSRSLSYRFFWWLTYACVIVLIYVGAATYFLPYNDWAKFSDVLLLTVSIGYLIAIVTFVRRCIMFNKHSGVLAAIRNEVKYDEIVSTVMSKWYELCLYLSKRTPCKDDVWKNSRAFKYGHAIGAWKANPKHLLMDRLEDLVKYSMKVNDIGTFNSIMILIQEEINDQKYSLKGKELIPQSNNHFQLMLFFESIIPYCDSCPEDKHIGESLVFSFLSVYNMCAMPCYGCGFDVIRVWRKVKNVSLLGEYIDWSKFKFSYIHKLSHVACVRGGNNDYQDKIEVKAMAAWEELCNFHYVMFAYQIRNGNYELLRYLLSTSHYGRYNLYPLTSSEVLLRYSKCKKSISDNYYFSHFDSDTLFEEKVNFDELIDRYTAFLLLLTTQENHYLLDCAKAEDLNKLKKAKPAIVEYAKIVQRDDAFLKLYPNTTKVDVSSVFDHAIDELRTFIAIPNQESTKKGNGFWSILCLWCNPPAKESVKDFYAESINQNIDKEIVSAFGQGRVRSRIPLDFFSTEEVDNTLTYRLSPANFEYSKWLFINKDNIQYLVNNICIDASEVKNSALLGTLLKIFGEMTVEEEVMDSGNFHSYFMQYSKKHPENYVIVDVGGHLKSLDIQVFRRDWHSYEGAMYVDADTSVMFGLLKDTPEYKRFEDSILVVHKSVVPAIVFDNDKGKPNVEVTDVSCKAESKFTARVKIDFGITLKYTPKSALKQIIYRRHK